MPPSRFAHRKSHGYARSTSCGFVDLALLHFPCSRFEDTLRAYKVLVDARDRGLTRAIGVSNFNASLLQALLDAVEAPSLGRAGARPAVVQNAFSVAGHPAKHDGVGNACLEGSRLYGSTDETLELAQREGIVFQAYSPSAARRTSTCSGGARSDASPRNTGGRRRKSQCGGSSSSASAPCRRRRICARGRAPRRRAVPAGGWPTWRRCPGLT